MEAPLEASRVPHVSLPGHVDCTWSASVLAHTHIWKRSPRVASHTLEQVAGLSFCCQGQMRWGRAS